jgi:flagellin-like protein
MMKLKKSMKNRSAVSPVIATILMVAITVVLAAVLYVMVMGFGGPSNSAPTGSFSNKQLTDGNYTLTFGKITPDTKPSDLQISIVGGGVSGTCALTDKGADITNTGKTVTVTVTYQELSANEVVNNGESITIESDEGLASGTYTVTLIHVPTGDSVTSTTFTIA